MAFTRIEALGTRTSAASDQLTRRVVRSSLALGIRQVLVHGLNATGGILLARLLAPAEFGVFAVVTFLLGFLLAFGDVGLGASLVRQQDEPEARDYQAVFTFQQLLVFGVVAAFWPLAPLLAEVYARPADEVWLFRLVALSLLLTSLQTIPSIRLERHLRFERLGIIEVAQALAFNTVAVVLAVRGMGGLSFGYALAARALTGAVGANLLSPWPLGWHWDTARIRHHLRFGLPYQGISVVSMVKDSLSPVLIGMLVSTVAVGYVSWAQMVAAYPVLVLFAFQRIYLPAFSRIAEAGELRRFVEGVLRLTNLVVAPIAVLTLVLARPLTPLVFGAQWLPALPVFYLLWAANLVVPTATPLLSLLNAQGASNLAFRFALLWMIGTWALGAPLALRFGAVGYGMANLLVQFTNLLLFRVVQRRVEFSILRPVLPPWLAAAAAGVVTYAVVHAVQPHTLSALGLCATVGLVNYLLALVALIPGFPAREWMWLRTA